MASEAIYKLQPNRTIHLRGFNGFGAAAALTQTSATGMTLSGVFRDAADFAVLILWDEDDFFGHPRIKYLPDPDFRNMVLSFDLQTTNLIGIDSAKSATIAWPYLSYIRHDGTSGTISLLAHATQSGGTFTSASGTFTVTSGSPSGGDWAAVWFQNSAFQAFMPAGSALSRSFTFFAGINGTVNTITIGGNSYSHVTAGDSSAGVAAILAAAANSDPNCFASAASNVVTLTPKLDSGAVVTCSGTGGGSANLWEAVHPATVLAADLASQINGASYTGTYALTATSSAGDLTLTAVVAADGRPSGRDGNMIRMYGQATGGFSITPLVQLAGGTSAPKWTVSIDFTALGIDSLRQLWLTFAPRLADSAAYTAEEWSAVFTNWTVTDPSSHRALKVAAPGSVRIEETDSWCSYAGTWAAESGIFFSRGFARESSTFGDTVTILYTCQHTHDLYLGTSLYTDRGKIGVSLDGGAETILDCYLNAEPAVVTRRRVRSGVAAGAHLVTLSVHLRNVLSSANHCYFDFLEAAVLGDVPDPPASLANVSPAIDYDTDHGYKLSPQYLLWIFDKLGFAGPMNEYLGVFWWNQRKNATAVFPSVVVTFGGTYAAGDAIFLDIGGTSIGKTVFSPDTVSSIAKHFEYFINETFVGVWASATAGVLTITNRSPESAYDFTFSVSATSAAGTVGFTGSLAYNSANAGAWVIDPAQTPEVNVAARNWHADLYAGVAARSNTITTSLSMELVNPPDDPAGGQVWAARFVGGTPVTTSTGFGGLLSTHCATGAANFLAYQQAAFVVMAGLQSAAGLTPEMQLGEFLWWFFADASGMAYYDDETTAAAAVALGHSLHTFLTADDDPAPYAADALFLRNRLRDHAAAVGTAVKTAYPSALLELLYPYDVNYPSVYGRFSLGGKLNAYVNLPTEWKTKAGSGFDRVKVEALDFCSGTRSLDLAREAIRLAITWGWPLDSIRYLFPVFNGGCPFVYEQQIALDNSIPFLTPFAMDHVCLMGWEMRDRLTPDARRF